MVERERGNRKGEKRMTLKRPRTPASTRPSNYSDTKLRRNIRQGPAQKRGEKQPQLHVLPSGSLHELEEHIHKNARRPHTWLECWDDGLKHMETRDASSPNDPADKKVSTWRLSEN
ncbi:hypothetical protein Bca4012_027626 [Brassica carinata]